MSEKDIAELWGDDLYDALFDHLDENGWLTADWSTILEDYFSNWDEDYNDTNEKRYLYSLMYNTDFETSLDENFIRPVKDQSS